MSMLDELKFVKKIPTVSKPGVDPLKKVREAFAREIDMQIELVRNPEFVTKKTVNKRDGTSNEISRRPRPWFVIDGNDAFITVRIANKPVALGGKRGSVIQCLASDLSRVLSMLKQWAETSEARDVIEKAMKSKKRSTKKAGAFGSGG